MTKRTEIVEVRLPQKTAAGVHVVAKLAGVKPETVIKVMMALILLAKRPTTPPNPEGSGSPEVKS